MAGLLDGYLTNLGGSPAGAFPATAPPPEDAERAAVDAASEAAARRVRNAVRRPRPEGFPSPEISSAGMLAAAPTGTPPQVWGAAPTAAESPVPLPRPRPADLDPAALPSQAQPAIGAGPDAMAAATPADTGAAPARPSGLMALNNVIARNPLTLMAMGAGMMGAPSFAQGASRGLAAAIPASQQDTKQALQQSSIAETYKSLVGRGVSPQEALAAVYNPDVMKAVAAKYFETQKPIPIGKDQFGQDIMGVPTRSGMYAPPNAPHVESVADVAKLPKDVPVFVDPKGMVRRNPNYAQ